MKKIIFTLIAAILLSVSIAGCNNANDNNQKNSPNEITENTTNDDFSNE